jgi:hypothetical protein
MPPYKMSASVLYYIAEGQRYLFVEKEQAELRTGSFAVFPASSTLSISANKLILVLAIQLM